MVEWIKRKCPVCGDDFKYPDGIYNPDTCNKFDCTYKYIHNPNKYKSFLSHLDKCRKEAGV